jgi:protein-disulfide isomerase
MGKRAQRKLRMAEPGAEAPESRRSTRQAGSSWGATIMTVAALAVFGLLSVWQSRQLGQAVGYRLDQIDTRLSQLSEKVEKVASQPVAAAPSRGPDPNRVYTVKTAGAPFKGPLSAPVTIAEFSDFQ